MFKQAYGFLTRGCVNRCSFCIVPRKEGTIRGHADITEFIVDRKAAILMDNNAIACEWGLSQIEKIIALKIKVDFNQGLDCRLIAKDKSIAGLLKRVSWIRFIRMAYDHSSILEEVETAIAYLQEAGIPTYKLFFYLLVRDGQIEDAQRRAMSLARLGCTPFAMPYRDLETNTLPTEGQRRFARWVNMKAAFNSCTYEQFQG